MIQFWERLKIQRVRIIFVLIVVKKSWIMKLSSRIFFILLVSCEIITIKSFEACELDDPCTTLNEDEGVVEHANKCKQFKSLKTFNERKPCGWIGWTPLICCPSDHSTPVRFERKIVELCNSFGQKARRRRSAVEQGDRRQRLRSRRIPTFCGFRLSQQWPRWIVVWLRWITHFVNNRDLGSSLLHENSEAGSSEAGQGMILDKNWELKQISMIVSIDINRRCR